MSGFRKVCRNQTGHKVNCDDTDKNKTLKHRLIQMCKIYRLIPHQAYVTVLKFLWSHYIPTYFFVIKPTRCTNFTNLFCHETLHVSDSSSVHHQEFIHCLSIYLSIYLFIYLSRCLSIYLSVYISIYLPICLSIYLSTYLSIYLLSVYLSTYLSICLSIYLSNYLSIYLSVYLSVCLSIHLSICLSVYLSIYLSICLSIYLSIYLSICLSIYPDL